MNSVLLVEDDHDLIVLLQNYLARYGFTCFSVSLPSVALDKLKTEQFDLCLLDLTLPEMDGLELCKIIKKDFPSLPIIISTARGDVSDKVIGFDAGADDYIAKPYDPRELVARMQMLIKRYSQLIPQQQESPFSIDENRLTVFQNAQAVDFTLAEYELFVLLLKNPHRVLSREFILNSVNAMDWESSDKSINVIIGRIRSKIGDDPKKPHYIRSVRGVGYQYVGD